MLFVTTVAPWPRAVEFVPEAMVLLPNDVAFIAEASDELPIATVSLAVALVSLPNAVAILPDAKVFAPTKVAFEEPPTVTPFTSILELKVLVPAMVWLVVSLTKSLADVLTALVTKAVVASCVVLVPAVAVGAKGVPVKVGEAIFAFKFKASAFVFTCASKSSVASTRDVEVLI